jgi:hypothetical protein
MKFEHVKIPRRPADISNKNIKIQTLTPLKDSAFNVGTSLANMKAIIPFIERGQ